MSMEIRRTEDIVDDQRPSAFGGDWLFETKEMTTEERERVVERGRRFAEQAGGTWLLITGKFISDNFKLGTEGHLREALLRAYGYPGPTPDPNREIKLLLDSPGGSLDSAYATVLYLTAYTRNVKVYVPGKAKSASTLVALGGSQLHLSPFGELGPLDTQVYDPRNPANRVSALDCYQSVDYVRNFGRKTLTSLADSLITETERKMPAGDLLDKSSEFALGAITPMLADVSALDFGGWGRSLMIGERYIRKLLSAKTSEPDEEKINRIAYRLVYGYTHHLFPIDFHEAEDIGLRDVGLDLRQMDAKTYQAATGVLRLCANRNFVGFLNSTTVSAEDPAGWQESGDGTQPPANGDPSSHGRGTEHAEAWGSGYYRNPGD